jgi:tRNA (cytidine/uridine-2'-O-)-methyltransferase
LDYWSALDYVLHDSWRAFLEALPQGSRVWAYSSKVTQLYTEVEYRPGDYLIFGPESRGLPPEVLAHFPAVTIPMPGSGRSLNLAVAVGVGLYEALRQVNFQAR